MEAWGREKGYLAIEEAYRGDETRCMEAILPLAAIPPHLQDKIQFDATEWVKKVRNERLVQGGLDAFLIQYDLSSEEGLVLMCLAESLLRIPDNETIDKLIRDKLTKGDWHAHLGQSPSLFVNTTTWALLLADKVIEPSVNLPELLKRLVNQVGEPLVRNAVKAAMKILGRQFVIGRTIDSALKRALKNEKRAIAILTIC